MAGRSGIGPVERVAPRGHRATLAVALVVAACGALGGCRAASVEGGLEPALAPGPPGPGGGAAGGGAPASGPGLVLPEPGPGAGAPPAVGTCASEVHTAERAPVDLLLLVDTSDSMNQLSGARSKWELTRQALQAFVGDPASAGLGVGLLFFPSTTPPATTACQQDGDCAAVSPAVERACRKQGFCFAPGLPVITNRACAPNYMSPFNCPAGMMCLPQGRCPLGGGPCVEGAPCSGAAGDTCRIDPGVCLIQGGGCDRAPYQRLDVEVGELPAQAGPLTAALAARAPDGSTPLPVAAQAALAFLRARASSQPGRRAALVLATDGLPSPGCGEAQPVEAVVSRLEQGRSGAPSIPSYVVGVFGANGLAEARPALERFASAGGTGAPFILTTGDDLSQRLLEALQTIRGQAVACEYAIPRPATGALDLARVNVRTTSARTVEELAQVPAADRCLPDRGGWYYETPAPGAPPARLVICPASCARLRTDPTARVDLLFGCATRTID